VLLGQAIIALVLGGVLSGEPEAVIVSGNIPANLDGRRAGAELCAASASACLHAAVGNAGDGRLLVHTMLGRGASCHRALLELHRGLGSRRSCGRHDGLQAGSATQGQATVPSRDLSMNSASICAVGGLARVYVTHGVLRDAAAIGASLFLIVLASILLGTALPFALSRAGLDPAHAGSSIQVRLFRFLDFGWLPRPPGVNGELCGCGSPLPTSSVSELRDDGCR
jgi:hypothetical protein